MPIIVPSPQLLTPAETRLSISASVQKPPEPVSVRAPLKPIGPSTTSVLPADENLGITGDLLNDVQADILAAKEKKRLAREKLKAEQAQQKKYSLPVTPADKRKNPMKQHREDLPVFQSRQKFLEVRITISSTVIKVLINYVSYKCISF